MREATHYRVVQAVGVVVAMQAIPRAQVLPQARAIMVVTDMPTVAGAPVVAVAVQAVQVRPRPVQAHYAKGAMAGPDLLILSAVPW